MNYPNEWCQEESVTTANTLPTYSAQKIYGGPDMAPLQRVNCVEEVRPNEDESVLSIIREMQTIADKNNALVDAIWQFLKGCCWNETRRQDDERAHSFYAELADLRFKAVNVNEALVAIHKILTGETP